MTDARLEAVLAEVRPVLLAEAELAGMRRSRIATEALTLVLAEGHAWRTCRPLFARLGRPRSSVSSAVLRATGRSIKTWLALYRHAVGRRLAQRFPLSQREVAAILRASSPQAYGRTVKRYAPIREAA
jgi:hypothetical protein